MKINSFLYNTKQINIHVAHSCQTDPRPTEHHTVVSWNVQQNTSIWSGLVLCSDKVGIVRFSDLWLGQFNPDRLMWGFHWMIFLFTSTDSNSTVPTCLLHQQHKACRGWGLSLDLCSLFGETSTHPGNAEGVSQSHSGLLILHWRWKLEKVKI